MNVHMMAPVPPSAVGGLYIALRYLLPQFLQQNANKGQSIGAHADLNTLRRRVSPPSRTGIRPPAAAAGDGV